MRPDQESTYVFQNTRYINKWDLHVRVKHGWPGHNTYGITVIVILNYDEEKIYKWKGIVEPEVLGEL